MLSGKECKGCGRTWLSFLPSQPSTSDDQKMDSLGDASFHSKVTMCGTQMVWQFIGHHIIVIRLPASRWSTTMFSSVLAPTKADWLLDLDV
jgi:hypothetical protein